MAKESVAMLGCEGVERTGQGRLEFVQVAGRRLAQMGFEFGKGQFDRVKIGAVGRQVAQAHAPVRENVADALDFVGGQVVQDECISPLQVRTEDFLQIDREDFGIDRPIHQKRGRETFVAEGGNKGGTPPMTVWDGTEAAFTLGAAAMEPGHFSVQAGFVQEHQPAYIPTGLLAAPAHPCRLNVGPVLFGGARRFFYNSTPVAASDATKR